MRVTTVVWTALTLLALASGGLAQDEPGQDLGDDWPFGAAVRQSRFQGLDLYNLGLIGAKAGDAAVPRKKPGPMPQGRTQNKIEKEANDDGPEKLRVDIVVPDGPGAMAGLRSGDVIVKAGGKSFKKGSLATIANALLKAESTKGVLKIDVERPGTKGTVKLELAIPVGGKEAAKPTVGVGREKLIAPALKWLAEQQNSDGGYTETLSGRNGAVVLTSLAGLCWLGGGSDLEKGEYKDNVQKALEYVSGSLSAITGSSPKEGEPSWDQSNWGYAHAAIFLGELHHRNPTAEVQEPLLECGRRLAERQEKSGGWAHGEGGPNALGYLELNIVSGLAISGLGLAKQAGYEVPEAVMKKAEEYLRASSSGDGGIGYSDRPGQRGSGNIGRTAASWLGYLNLGLGKSPWAKKMGGYVKRYAGHVLGGHASLTQHILLAGVAAHAQGGEAQKSYWDTMERDLVLARSVDGSFQPRPWHETKGKGSNSDVTFGQVWTTTAWTCVLVSSPSKDGTRPGLPGWTGKLAGK